MELALVSGKSIVVLLPALNCSNLQQLIDSPPNTEVTESNKLRSAISYLPITQTNPADASAVGGSTLMVLPIEVDPLLILTGSCLYVPPVNVVWVAPKAAIGSFRVVTKVPAVVVIVLVPGRNFTK
jgi:hypothetical protein